MEKFEITWITRDGLIRAEKVLPQEIPLTIEVNGKEIATVLASALFVDDLVRGFLFTSGMISGLDEIRSLFIDTTSFRAVVEMENDPGDFIFKRIYTSGCGRGVIFHNPVDVMGKTPLPDGFRIQSGKLLALMRHFMRQPDYADIRGIHRTALSSPDEICLARVDIGRHNSVDKVIGAALAARLDMSDTILLTTGRVSSEILSKLLRARIPLVAALGSATDQAVKMARAVNITIAARLKGGRGEIYSAEQRIF